MKTPCSGLLMLLLAAGVAAAPPNARMGGGGCSNATCPWKLWSHYKEKGCEPAYDGSATSCCPSRFKCPKRTANAEGGCWYGGRSFAVGSAIDQSDSCRVCTCQPSGAGPAPGPSIQCLRSECPELFGHAQGRDPSCRLLYKENECCSVETKCTPSSTAKELTSPAGGVVCRAGNRSYVEGERMQFEADEGERGGADQCSVCVCGGAYEGPRGPGCRRVDFCYLERQTELSDGCAPVYHEDTCCPVDFICPGREVQEAPPTGTSAPAEEAEQVEEGCVFAGRHYPMGSDMATPMACTTCTCATPPEFTCVQRRC